MNKGFSLIQLIIVIAIISIIAGYFSFQFSSSIDHVKLNAYAKVLMADIVATQAAAVATHLPQEIGFLEDRYIIMGKEKFFPTSIKVKVPRVFKFAPSGLPYPGYTGTVTLTLKNITKSIILSSAGRARIE